MWRGKLQTTKACGKTKTLRRTSAICPHHSFFFAKTHFFRSLVVRLRNLIFFSFASHLPQILLKEKMALNETISNATKPKGPSMDALIDPDANPVFGFWVNGVAIILIGIVGIFGNCASIRVLSHKQMRSSVNFILIALASSDLILIATSILLFGLMTVFPYNGMLKDYYFIIQPHIVKVVFPLAMIGEYQKRHRSRKCRQSLVDVVHVN